MLLQLPDSTLVAVHGFQFGLRSAEDFLPQGVRLGKEGSGGMPTAAVHCDLLQALRKLDQKAYATFRATVVGVLQADH